jgi:hypothetical protein
MFFDFNYSDNNCLVCIPRHAITVRYLTFFSFYEFFCSGGAKEIALAISSLDVMIQNRFQVKGLSLISNGCSGVGKM